MRHIIDSFFFSSFQSCEPSKLSTAELKNRLPLLRRAKFDLEPSLEPSVNYRERASSARGAIHHDPARASRSVERNRPRIRSMYGKRVVVLVDERFFHKQVLLSGRMCVKAIRRRWKTNGRVSRRVPQRVSHRISILSSPQNRRTSTSSSQSARDDDCDK